MSGRSKYSDEKYVGFESGILKVKEYLDIHDSRNTENTPAFLCECQCGNIVVKKASHVVNGNIKSCGKCHISRSKYQTNEYIGKKFGKLEVVGLAHNGTLNCFECYCDCDPQHEKLLILPAYKLVNGYQKCCVNCYQDNLATKRYTQEYLDAQIGKRFGKLVVTGAILAKGGEHSKLICDCDCGTKGKAIMACNLLWNENYGRRACGLCRVAPNHKYDSLEYIEQTFNYLTVKEIIKADNKTYWKCQCGLCGAYKNIIASHVVSGNNKSCGCLQSYGEEVIRETLDSLNIMYERQVTFYDLKGIRGGTLRFDFGIYKQGKLQALIEYDGEQHFMEHGLNGYYEVDENNNSIIMQNDEIKNRYCSEHNIKLVRINGIINHGKVIEILNNNQAYNT